MLRLRPKIVSNMQVVMMPQPSRAACAALASRIASPSLILDMSADVSTYAIYHLSLLSTRFRDKDYVLHQISFDVAVLALQ